MTRIFSNVVADIDNELAEKFPADFDYVAMVRKVSEEAGVDVQTTDSVGDGKHISLQGIWVAMERVHSLLATALAVYGARVLNRDTPTPPPPDLNNTAFTTAYSEQDCGSLITHTNNVEYITEKLTIPKSVNREIKADLKTDAQNNCMIKKDHMQKRKQSNIFSSSADKAFFVVHERKCKNVQRNHDEQDDEDTSSSKTDEESIRSMSPYVPEQTVKKKRGRPRKYPPAFSNQRTYAKFRSKFSRRKKFRRLKNTVNDDGIKLCRGRGRPRKFPEGTPEEFPCPECDFVAKTRNTLGDHKHRVHLASPTICDICQKVFPNRRYMKRHRSSHVEPQHCCDVCGKMYKIRKAMLEHKKTHEEGYARPSFQCDLCPKSFCSNYILSCHVKSEHLGQKKSFLCSVCGKSFTTKHSLQEHLNAHTGAKPHICEICGKGFCYESALRDHKFVHVGAKQFICEVCSKAFTQRSGLKMHMRIHQQNKQFMCSDCGREFTQKQALQRHERVHKGDKPFICKLCSRTFSDASIIRRHMILVHKIHKDANTWREDIICKVQGALNYHVEKISELEEKLGQQISKSVDVDVDVLAAASKATELPAGSGTVTPVMGNHAESTYSAYRSNTHTDTGQSNLSQIEDHSMDMSDESGHASFQGPGAPSPWHPSPKQDLRPHMLKENFTSSLKREASGSVGASFLNSEAAEQSHSQLSYMDDQSPSLSQENLQSKILGNELVTDGHFDTSPSTTYQLAQPAKYSVRHSSDGSRPQQYTPHLNENPEDQTESYPSNIDRHNTSRLYPSATETTERPSNYPQMLTDHNERQILSQENLDFRDRPSHIPLGFTDRDERHTFHQEDPSPSERTAHYPTITSPSVRPDSALPNSSGSSSFPTSSSQPWSSMYAYYSHLASQFGMTLGDYPYMANPGNSHQ